MTDLELVTEEARKFEGLLKKRFGAKGNGMGEQARSIKEILPRPLLINLLYISRVRNAVIHEGKEIPSRTKFERLCEQTIQDLENLEQPQQYEKEEVSSAQPHRRPEHRVPEHRIPKHRRM